MEEQKRIDAEAAEGGAQEPAGRASRAARAQGTASPRRGVVRRGGAPRSWRTSSATASTRDACASTPRSTLTRSGRRRRSWRASSAAIERGAPRAVPRRRATRPASDAGDGADAVPAGRGGGDRRAGRATCWPGWAAATSAHSRFDRVKQARRQAGSAFKPFVYAAALQSGRALNQTAARRAAARSAWTGGASWEPKNFDGAFDGEVTLRDALVRSKNVPTVRLAQEVGTARGAELAEEAGHRAAHPATSRRWRWARWR